MICTCEVCRQAFWRYRRDFPPRGVCSLSCFHDRQNGHGEESLELPHIVWRRLRQHMSMWHNSTSILIWPDCEECEAIQARYAESLNFHFDQVAADIAAASQTIRKEIPIIHDYT